MNRPFWSRGVKLISWEYPEPVVNSFVFSHIALLSGEAVLPMTLIGAVALLDVIVGLLVMPITALVKLIDIEGSSEAWNHQMTYLVPALSLLGVAVSVALRRKGFKRAALILSWIGLIVFALLYISY